MNHTSRIVFKCCYFVPFNIKLFVDILSSNNNYKSQQEPAEKNFDQIYDIGLWAHYKLYDGCKLVQGI